MNIGMRQGFKADSPTGSLLGLTTYNPTTQTQVNTSVTNPTMTDVDATNLTVTFVVPSSGRVIVRLDGNGAGNAGDTALFWGLREGSTSLTATCCSICVDSNGENNRHHLTMVITGLVPGSTHTYKWGQAASYNTVNAHTIFGGISGASVMEVWAA